LTGGLKADGDKNGGERLSLVIFACVGYLRSGPYSELRRGWQGRNAERVAREAPEGDAGNPFSLMTLGLERQLFQQVRDRSGKNRLIPDL
jgi:hypothetical protein